MNIKFAPTAKKQYLAWREKDKEISRKINSAIRLVIQKPFSQSVPLNGDLAGYWSRKIDKEHRFVYKIEDDTLYIIQCEYHYSELSLNL